MLLTKASALLRPGRLESLLGKQSQVSQRADRRLMEMIVVGQKRSEETEPEHSLLCPSQDAHRKIASLHNFNLLMLCAA